MDGLPDWLVIPSWVTQALGAIAATWMVSMLIWTKTMDAYRAQRVADAETDLKLRKIERDGQEPTK